MWNAELDGQVLINQVAVLQLLNMRLAAVGILLNHLIEFGEKTAFQEDVFFNKKLSIVARSRAGNKIWNERLTVTHEALVTMLKYIHRQHQKKLPGTHQKPRKEA